MKRTPALVHVVGAVDLGSLAQQELNCADETLLRSVIHRGGAIAIRMLTGDDAMARIEPEFDQLTDQLYIRDSSGFDVGLGRGPRCFEVLYGV